MDLEVFDMADKSVRYTPEFKRQMVDLVRGGRGPDGVDDFAVGEAG